MASILSGSGGIPPLRRRSSSQTVDWDIPFADADTDGGNDNILDEIIEEQDELNNKSTPH